MSEHEGSMNEHDRSSDEEGADMPLLATQRRAACSVCKRLHRICHNGCIYAKDFPRDEPSKLQLLLDAEFTVRYVGDMIRNLDEKGRTAAVNKLLQVARAKLLKQAKAKEKYPQHLNTKERAKLLKQAKAKEKYPQHLNTKEVVPTDAMHSLIQEAKALTQPQGTTTVGQLKRLVRDSSPLLLTEESPAQFSIEDDVQMSPQKHRISELNIVLQDTLKQLARAKLLEEAKAKEKYAKHLNTEEVVCTDAMHSLTQEAKALTQPQRTTTVQLKSLLRDTSPRRLTDESPPQFSIEEDVQLSPHKPSISELTSAVQDELKQLRVTRAKLLEDAKAKEKHPKHLKTEEVVCTDAMHSLIQEGKALTQPQGTTTVGQLKSLFRDSSPLRLTDESPPQFSVEEDVQKSPHKPSIGELTSAVQDGLKQLTRAKLLKEAKAKEKYPHNLNTEEVVRTNATNRLIQEVKALRQTQAKTTVSPQKSLLRYSSPPQHRISAMNSVLEDASQALDKLAPQSIKRQGKRSRDAWEGTSAASSLKSHPVHARKQLLYALQDGFGAVTTDLSEISKKVESWKSIVAMLLEFEI